MTPRFLLATIATTLLLLGFTPASTASELPRLQADGPRVIDSDGRPVVLRGVNLGNWLILETWMTAWPEHDQAEVFRTLDERFGESERRRLMDVWRTGYVAPRDFEIIKSFDFNVVRVPFDYRLLESDDDPVAFRWLDRALEMAEAAGIYVILDLHVRRAGRVTSITQARPDVIVCGMTKRLRTRRSSYGRGSLTDTRGATSSPLMTCSTSRGPTTSGMSVPN